MANKTIVDLTAASLPLDLTELLHVVQDGNSRKVTSGDLLAEVKWLCRAIGEPFPIWDHITGADVPAIDSASYRFIKLTAGLTGSGQYNEGVLTSESNTGSAPLVIATAVIVDAASPMDGETVSLINTERRFLRAGSSGTAQQDAVQGHLHEFTSFVSTGGGNLASSGTPTSSTPNQTGGPVTDGANGTPRTDSETRSKNIGATYYMRIR